ncbi:MAG: UPF0182 family protein [Acidobacteriia bacterium]|nr:UPF0182 family protein [Terriglobia bacterium]
MPKDRRPRLILALILFILVVLPILTNGVDLLVDWLWFKSEGYRVIYLTILKSQIALSGWAGLGFIAVASLNLYIARLLSRRHGYRVYGETIEFPALDRFTSAFRWAIWGGVLLVGYGVSQWGMSHWLEYLLARNPSEIAQHDPLFNLGLGFYLFQLPFNWFLYHLALVTLIVCLLSAVFLYLVEGGVWVTPRGPVVAASARAHLMVLGGLIFLLIAYRVRLAMYGLLFSPRGTLYGAGYTDVHATLPALQLLLVLSIVTALIFFAEAKLGHIRPALYAVGALIVIALIGTAVYPEIIQRFIVAPNEIDKERPYIANSIEFTRAAYGLDRFEERQFSAVEDLTLNDIRQNQATLRNVRLWDHKPLLTTFAQLQEIRTYYDFRYVDNDRYWIDGVYRQVSLSPRELSSQSLPGRTWINEHLTYTHGYGLCLGPVNEVTSDGLPELLIKNIPPVSTASIRVTQPAIYYGELGNEYCFVKTHAQEFDYPKGDENVYTNYQGSGGIPVGGFWKRLLFTAEFGEKNILFSSDIQPSSRLMIYRRVLDRAGRLTPFLRYDSDPYMVIADDGSLYWMLDAYTASSWYPYSEPTEDMGNFIRNSVKVTINAYSGAVHFYVVDPTDPLVEAYARIFPGVFEPLSAMPKDLLAHIRYPEGLFSIQAQKYALFHMTDPRVLYNREDLWRVAQTSTGGPPRPMTPYYNIMKLAEVGTSEEFILMVPFTPSRKDNMIAWMAARCDAPNYGKVLVFTFPKEKLVFGPQQVEARIDQDPTISQQLTLWGQGGSKVIRGTLLVIPIMNSVLYVEPLYLSAEAGGALPQLKRVIVAYSDHVLMENSLDDALTKIFGGAVSTAAGAPRAAQPGAAATPAPGAAKPAAPLAPNLQQLVQEANQHYERALQLQRQGDWAGYGDEIKKLGETLRKLAAAQGQQ